MAEAKTHRKSASKGKRPDLFGIKRTIKPGSAPGVLKPPRRAMSPEIDAFSYSPDTLTEHRIENVEEIAELRRKGQPLWINVTGLGDVELIRRLGEIFKLHSLSLEDSVNVHQRAKADYYDNYIFIVARMLQGERQEDTEQVSIFFGNDFLLSLQERPGDCFDGVRARLREGRGRIRSSPPDYLAYALVDAIIDGFFPRLEDNGEQLEALEDEIVASPEPDHVQQLHELKRELLLTRRAVWPLREMLNMLIRDDHALLSDSTRIYFRDCYDHVIQLMDIVETYREIASALIDVYISSVSAKMNEVMKVLTIIATIFIPLGFIAGLYGMNFDAATSPWNMPELRWRYGYPAALLLMLSTVGAMTYYFWRKGWFGTSRPRNRSDRRSHKE